ncbi:9656_t:CDS:2 [Ambispora gerdemannii]|uniref:9656_t:CDS:1 n=1 Tax=Ambispora gerdemannii TaxID=144530 RepID=A0A9N9GG28_9GLOM|nr:9656_t:CDS:2 [Ambispora gerdemannii]
MNQIPVGSSSPTISIETGVTNSRKQTTDDNSNEVETQKVKETGVRALFSTLRDSLDEHYNTREIVIRHSKDITFQSKKLIYIGHRIINSSLDAILKEAAEKHKEIFQLFKDICVHLSGVNYFRYLRNMSNGFQEYTEAMAFLRYLEHGDLIKKDEIEANLLDESGNKFLQITDLDYVLGIADLTGELMRYAINSVGKGDHTRPLEICQFLRNLKAQFSLLNAKPNSPIGKKMEDMKSNLQKVELVCYALTIHGSEYPKEFYEFIVSEHSRSSESIYGH